MTFLAPTRDPALKVLVEILTYKRGYSTSSELDFLNSWLIPRLRPYGVEVDAVGNLIVRVGESNVLWSCHTDTVHRKEGRQNVRYEGDILHLNHGKPGDCLGADDGAGIWLMLEMLKAGKPGLYIFHRGEEDGGIGSSFIAKTTPEVLKGIDMAIAFDRAGVDNVITEQTGGLCASDEFANSLADQLPGMYHPDPTGVFTDTANYTDLIPECTNLSVGYEKQHGLKETQDTAHLVKMRDALLVLDTSKLVVKRTPGDDGYDGFGPYSMFSGYGHRDFGKTSTSRRSYGGGWSFDDEIEDRVERSSGSAWGLADLVAEWPNAAADLLEQLGVDRAKFVEHIGSAYRG